MKGRDVGWVLGATVVVTLLAGCGAPAGEAELVLLNGKVVTLDPARPEAEAVAVSSGEILAVGDDDQIRSYVGRATRVLDLEGHLAIPGFIEGHGHFTGLGRQQLTLDVGGAATWDEIAGRVAEAAAEAADGEWIVGRGWHQEKWEEAPSEVVEGFPTHTALSEAAPEHPVFLVHASGHASIVNARAMELAGVNRRTVAPPGGRILRFADGRPTGLLQETAEGLVQSAYDRYLALRTPEEVEAEAEREIELADRACLAHGVTSFQDAGASYETVERLVRLAEEGKLGTRVWVMLGEGDDALEARVAEYRMIGAAGEHVTVRAIKRYIDGALGSRGAWLLEPYSDQEDTSGLAVAGIADLERTAEIAKKHDLQVCVHAIGDRGNREVLDLYERVLGGVPDGRDRRWRIEHAQHLHPDDIPRFAELGVIAAMQGVHCTSDGPWVAQRLGEERARTGAYVWRSLLDSGAVVANGTDTPVESVDPIANYHALVTRLMPNGERFYPEQRMTREEALRASTLDAAYAAFEEDRKGSLEPGKLADVTVLSRDILTVPEEEIPGTEVLYTIVGGRILYGEE